MLIFKRKAGESIIVGGNVVIKIVRLDIGEVSIGIDAPQNLTVNREEVQARIEAEKTIKPKNEKLSESEIPIGPGDSDYGQRPRD